MELLQVLFRMYDHGHPLPQVQSVSYTLNTMYIRVIPRPDTIQTLREEFRYRKKYGQPRVKSVVASLVYHSQHIRILEFLAGTWHL